MGIWITDQNEEEATYIGARLQETVTVQGFDYILVHDLLTGSDFVLAAQVVDQRLQHGSDAQGVVENTPQLNLRRRPFQIGLRNNSD